MEEAFTNFTCFCGHWSPPLGNPRLKELATAPSHDRGRPRGTHNEKGVQKFGHTVDGTLKSGINSPVEVKVGS